MPTVTFFVPCLNEEENVSSALNTIVSATSEVGVTYEILVVDDCSTDATVAVVELFARDHPEATIRISKNQVTMGLGHNYIEGALIARGDYYMMVCGDDAEPKESLVRILEKLGQADMVIPYFGANDCRSLFRRVTSRVFVFMVNLFSGNSIRYYNGIVLHRRENIARLRPDSRGFGYQAELITRLLAEGASYIEVEITNQDRKFGTTKAYTLKNFTSVGTSLLTILQRQFRRRKP